MRPESLSLSSSVFADGAVYNGDFFVEKSAVTHIIISRGAFCVVENRRRRHFDLDIFYIMHDTRWVTPRRCTYRTTVAVLHETHLVRVRNGGGSFPLVDVEMLFGEAAQKKAEVIGNFVYYVQPKENNST